MLEILTLFAIVTVGLVVVAAVAVAGFFLKLVFKVLFIPVAIVLGILKWTLLIGLGLVALVIAPVFLALLLLVGIPILLVAGAVGLGWSLVAA